MLLHGQDNNRKQDTGEQPQEDSSYNKLNQKQLGEQWKFSVFRSSRGGVFS